MGCVLKRRSHKVAAVSPLPFRPESVKVGACLLQSWTCIIHSSSKSVALCVTLYPFRSTISSLWRRQAAYPPFSWFGSHHANFMPLFWYPYGAIHIQIWRPQRREGGCLNARMVQIGCISVTVTRGRGVKTPSNLRTSHVNAWMALSSNLTGTRMRRGNPFTVISFLILFSKSNQSLGQFWLLDFPSFLL